MFWKVVVPEDETENDGAFETRLGWVGKECTGVFVGKKSHIFDVRNELSRT